MSPFLIIQDSVLRPELFHWRGPIATSVLNNWLRQQDLEGCPTDLRLFWQQTGGGDLFESETILGPFGDPELGDAVAPVNQDLRLRGLSGNLLVFHIGTTTSAIDVQGGDYIELNAQDFRTIRRFGTLDEWYLKTIRGMFSNRYGLR